MIHNIYASLISEEFVFPFVGVSSFYPAKYTLLQTSQSTTPKKLAWNLKQPIGKGTSYSNIFQTSITPLKTNMSPKKGLFQ